MLQISSRSVQPLWHECDIRRNILSLAFYNICKISGHLKLVIARQTSHDNDYNNDGTILILLYNEVVAICYYKVKFLKNIKTDLNIQYIHKSKKQMTVVLKNSNKIKK